MEKRLVYDYPRLAKESGFNFMFRFKRINWNKLDELDIEDIAFRGKYEQLEESIDLILNCDLDEDVTKVLDKNFVKLFRLAQISVGYLRHCLLYLDQCVVLLQDKLSNALQQNPGLNILKDEKDGFECEKCQKVFMTTSYWTAHQKRRHTNTEKSIEKSIATQTESMKSLSVNFEQQTDSIRTLVTSTQTICPEMLHKGVMTEIEIEKRVLVNEYEEKLDSVLKRLEAVEAKSEQPSRMSHANDENQQILEYLKNLAPLIIAPREEIKPLSVLEENQKGSTTVSEENEVNQPLLIDLGDTRSPEPVLVRNGNNSLSEEKFTTNQQLTIENQNSEGKALPTLWEMTTEDESTKSQEIDVVKPKIIPPRTIKRIKIASPIETSEEDDESIQLPVPKPRVSTANLHEKREAFVVEKPREDPKLITFTKGKDTVPKQPTELSLTEKIERKMRELGLDPEWTQLPDESFQNAMSVLEHQVQRKPSLGHLRKNLETELEFLLETKREQVVASAVSKPVMYDTDTDQESVDDWHEAENRDISEVRDFSERDPITASTPQKTRADEQIFEIRQTPQSRDDGKQSGFPVKTTDLSIFQVTGNGTQQDKTETDSNESEPVKTKSSIMIKNKEEPKKRVVFADNFVLETTHNNLLDIDNQSSSSSNSWDIQTP